jgi:hypothetical protein
VAKLFIKATGVRAIVVALAVVTALLGARGHWFHGFNPGGFGSGDVHSDGFFDGGG